MTKLPEDPFAGLSFATPEYSGRRVVEGVMWSAADELWRDNWRSNAAIGMEMTFPGRLVLPNALYDIELSACQSYMAPCDDEGETLDDFSPDLAERFSSGLIEVGEVELGVRREHTLNRLVAMYPRVFEACTKQEMVAKRITKFLFDSGLDLEIIQEHVVFSMIDPAKDRWVLTEENITTQPGQDDNVLIYELAPPLKQEDMDLLGIALKGLRLPKTYRSFKAIKPTESE